MMNSSSVSNSILDETSKIYYKSVVKSSALGRCVSIGDFSKISNSELYENVRIDRNNHIDSSRVGSYSYTGRNTIILSSNIGGFCAISWNVSIGGANHDYNRMTQHSFLYNQHDDIRPEADEIAYDRFEKTVTIGSDVWIAAGAVITRGVTVGDGAVIGANAVVVTDVPPYAIVVGSPAKILKYRFSEEIIELMLKLKWWRWDIEKIKNNYDYVSQEPTISILNKLLRENK